MPKLDDGLEVSVRPSVKGAVRALRGELSRGEMPIIVGPHDRLREEGALNLDIE